MQRTKMLLLVLQITLSSLCWFQATGQGRTAAGVSSDPGPGPIEEPLDDVQPNVYYFITQNFIKGSVYKRNANGAIIRAIQTPTLDRKVTKVGTAEDAVYSIAECYIDNTCERCLNAGVDGLRGVAPESIGGQIFFNITDYSCYLRFSPYDFTAPPAAPSPGTFSGSPSPEPSSRVYTTAQAPANPNQLFERTSTNFSGGTSIDIGVGALCSSGIAIILLVYCIRRHKLLSRRRRRALDTKDLPDVQGDIGQGRRKDGEDGGEIDARPAEDGAAPAGVCM